MAILAGSGKRLSTDDGIPYMWQSGDVYTEPTSVGIGSITSSNGASYDAFGFSVSIGGTVIVAGAPYKEVGSFANQGLSYIFDLNGNEVGIITASDGVANDNFGYSVAAACGKIVVGAPKHNSNSNSDQGAAYIYDYDGTNEVKLIASNGASYDAFGTSVAVGSGRIVVGATGDNNENGIDGGAAYVYDLDGNYITRLIASPGFQSDEFGISVASGTGRIVVGAHLSDVGLADDQGLAYIYHTPLVYTLYDAIELNYG